jgi:hypothetical protein
MKEKNKTRMTKPMIRHIVLGNNHTCQHDLEMMEKEEEEEILSFRPDNLDEFHPRLCHAALEFAWLLEESIYLYQDINFAYVYRYASPFLKLDIRSSGRNCYLDPTTLSGRHGTDFEQQRLVIRRRLQLGYRRGPIMSRLIANLRWEDGHGRQHDGATKTTTTTTSATNTTTTTTATNTTVADVSCIPSPSPLETRQFLAEEIVDPMPVQLTKKDTYTMTKLSSIVESPVKSSIKKRRITMTPKKSLQIQKIVTIPNKLHYHLSPSTTETKSVSPVLDFDPPSSLPQSNILTSLESEVAWLIEESLLANPSDGPLLSFVQDNASYTLRLHSCLCSNSSISNRRWLPRLYRSHDADVCREFSHHRLRIRKILQDGYRRLETKHLLPSEYTPPPLLTRVQQVYHQAFVTPKGCKRYAYSSRTNTSQGISKSMPSAVTAAARRRRRKTRTRTTIGKAKTATRTNR